VVVAYRPLPTTELYNPAAPLRGLLALLKHALWQTLWVDYGPPSGAHLQPDRSSRSSIAARVGVQQHWIKMAHGHCQGQGQVRRAQVANGEDGR
jgi:hypothetical protein